jgi:hypothetical protein
MPHRVQQWHGRYRRDPTKAHDADVFCGPSFKKTAHLPAIVSFCCRKKKQHFAFVFLPLANQGSIFVSSIVGIANEKKRSRLERKAKFRSNDMNLPPLLLQMLFKPGVVDRGLQATTTTSDVSLCPAPKTEQSRPSAKRRTAMVDFSLSSSVTSVDICCSS